MAEHTLMTLVWDDELGHIRAKLPDDPERSAQLCGPTSRAVKLPPEGLWHVAQGLPPEASAHLASLVRQYEEAASNRAQSHRAQWAQWARTASGAGEYRAQWARAAGQDASAT